MAARGFFRIIQAFFDGDTVLGGQLFQDFLLEDRVKVEYQVERVIGFQFGNNPRDLGRRHVRKNVGSQFVIKVGIKIRV